MSTDTKEQEDLSAANAAISKFTRTPVASAASPPSSPPASGSSGSSGAGSGSSGANNGSGGPPSGGSTGSSNNHGSGRNMTDAQKKVMLPIMMGVLLILSLGAMTLYYFAARSAMFMSTPEGVAQTDRMLAYSSEMDARRHAEEMKALENQGKRIDERRGLRSEKTASRDSVATSNTGKASPEAKCTVLEGAGNSRRQPAKLGTRICFSRESTETGHWLFLEAPVTKIQGVIRFSEMNMVADENGKMQILGEKDSCATNQSTDNCLTWLKGYVGTTTLWFTNRGPVEISAK